MSNNPMNAGMRAIAAHPRCGAHARTTGQPCRCPAMANGRCKLHGGKNPGAPTDVRNGNFKHGFRTRAAVAQRMENRELIKRLRELLIEFRRR